MVNQQSKPMTIRVSLAGATGWAGSAAARAIPQTRDIELVSAISRKHARKDRNSKKRASDELGKERMKVSQGDIFWISPNATNRIASDYTHPHMVIQDNTSDRVVVCALTSNLNRAKDLGNVLLDEGEANLPRQSAVVVSQISTVDKMHLGEYIGTLNEQRINQVLAGMQFLEVMTQHHQA